MIQWGFTWAARSMSEHSPYHQVAARLDGPKNAFMMHPHHERGDPHRLLAGWLTPINSNMIL